MRRSIPRLLVAAPESSAAGRTTGTPSSSSSTSFPQLSAASSPRNAGTSVHHRACIRSAVPDRFTEDEKRRLGTFFARATVCARLLQSRLALPLTYPVNQVSTFHLKENRQTAENTKQQAEVLGNMRPAIVGFSGVATLLKSLHALKHYEGAADRGLEPPKDPNIRLDFLRPQNLRRKRRQTRVGMGDGWDEYGSGRTADDVKRRFVADLWEEEQAKMKTTRGVER
mmetsp:Transcript_10556/g.25740  ORF Transcript_10556/g.25740 Transcript_10556/m.25740 type:complete len:226 (-) Transcript_10556:210-887(-)